MISKDFESFKSAVKLSEKVYYNINSSKHYTNWLSQEKRRVGGSVSSISSFNNVGKINQDKQDTPNLSNSKSQTYENFKAISNVTGKEIFPSINNSMVSTQIKVPNLKSKPIGLVKTFQKNEEMKSTNASLLTNTRFMKFSNMIETQSIQSD